VNVTVGLNLTDSAGTVSTIATTGAKAVNSVTSIVVLTAEFTYDPTASALAGQIGGYVGQSLVTAGALSVAVQPVFTQNVFATITPTVLLSAADAASVFTVDELTLELL